VVFRTGDAQQNSRRPALRKLRHRAIVCEPADVPTPSVSKAACRYQPRKMAWPAHPRSAIRAEQACRWLGVDARPGTRAGLLLWSGAGRCTRAGQPVPIVDRSRSVAVACHVGMTDDIP
jgi:hypothetical protein